ncbi:MAG: protein kinase domain-containing protein [Isosphaeraceae bacterium]
MTTPNDPTMSHDSLDAVIAAYMLAVEAGEVPNRQALLDQHPEHADSLRAFFADLDRMDRVASPLRVAGGPDETGAAEANGHTALPTVRYFGDYELLEEIARGGMGIVYKARQVSLNRLVALKMILAGSFASTRDIQRFRTEAESAANLDHPHIVPIYEVGEHEGQQYYSMKFVEGTSLAKHAQSDPRTEVEATIGVIRAVHHAHQRGVLHRDLKPSNVLVDSQGTRLVADFGLAKRLSADDGSFTETGQVLGTPRYMAPEQAAGRKDLTVAADVYSLGVILYERLTGQTPFTGDNALTLLRQARESEPPRPSSIRPGLDRDLETVVLKCLEKESGRRYPSAEALADDLANWLAGRPIAARPVGQAERFWRWCRRNPAVAGLTAAVALALVLGVVVSSFFAVAERRGRIRAEQAEQDAKAANERTERTFVQSLARPLDLDGDQENHGTLSEPETAALWELSLQQDKPIGLRFLEEATRDPIAVRQLRARSEPALIAAVGLDTARRERASSLLRERLRDQRLPLWSKTEVGFVALELEDKAGPASEACAGTIVQGLAGDHPENLNFFWRSHLIGASNRLDPSIAARLLAAELQRETDAYDRSLVASTLATLASRLEPAEAARICRKPIQILANALVVETDSNARNAMVGALVGLSARIEPAEAAKMLTTALAQQKEDIGRKALVKGLLSISARLEPAQAARVCGQAAQIVAEETGYHDWPGLESELATVSARFEPAQTARVWGKVAQYLVTDLARETNANTCTVWASCLERVSARLEPPEAAQVCGQAALTLVAALEREKDVQAWAWLADGLESVASRMEPTQARHIRGQAARLLIPSIERIPSTVSLDGYYNPGTQWVTLVSSWMTPSEAASMLAVAVERAENAEVRHAFVLGLASAAGRLEAAEDARICRRVARALIAALGRETNVSACPSLTDGIVVVVGRLDKIEAAQICGEAAQVLVASFAREKGAHARSSLASALSRVSERLDPAEAARICGQAARSLAGALDREKDDNARSSLASGLASLAGLADGSEVVSHPLENALIRETNDSRLVSIVVSLAGRSDPAEAERIYATAARVLAVALEHEKNGGKRFWLALDLASLARRFDSPKSAPIYGQVAQSLAKVLGWEIDESFRNTIGTALSSIAARMAPAESVRILGAALKQASNPSCLKALAQILSATLNRFDAAEAHRVCDKLLGSLDRDAFETIAPELLPQLKPDRAHALAWDLASRMCSGPEIDTETLSRILTDTSREQRARRAALMARAGGRRGAASGNRHCGRTPPLPADDAGTGRATQDANLLWQSPARGPRPPR